MSAIKKNVLDRTEEIVSSVCLGGMTLIIAVQVFQRYVLQSSLDWSEELARYLFIWSVYVGCSFATLADRHLEVTIIRSSFGPKVAKWATVAANLCTLVFCGCVTYWGAQMVYFLASTGQKTPALEIQMYWVFLSLPVGMGLMAFRTMQRTIMILRGEADNSVTPQEQ